MPYDTSTVSAVYAGEVWEHFELDDAVLLTKECCRILQPGGVLRVCVPDGVEFWSNYLQLVSEEMRKAEGDRSAQRLRNHVAMYFREICTRKSYFRSMGHTHKWQFDEIQLVELFESCGLADVSRMKFHHSRIPSICEVECSPFLIVEGVKSA
ncbi:MAG: methyltransferase domain-containing protein [Pirellulales bacterium]|nr:methyltransferase domain-containing protein [Pirellulales bacterium]